LTNLVNYALNYRTTIRGAICNDSKPSPLTDTPIIISPSGAGKTASAAASPKNTSENPKTSPAPSRGRSRSRICRGAGLGLPQALWQEATQAQVAHHVDQLCPKRAQGLSLGDYIRLAAINRACEPVSKQAMWDWVSRTCLPRLWPEVSAAQLTSQHFWDHMDLMEAEKAQSIWQQLIGAVLQREQIQLSQVCYDGTNFYTFIDTFNLKCHLAKRGKNKQGRCNLRQVSYALFCTTDGHLPLFYDVYEGNRHDAKEFPRVLEKFSAGSKRRPLPPGAPPNRRSFSTRVTTPPTTSP